MNAQEMAQEIREKVCRMIAISGGGHAGGSLSMAEILAGLFSQVLQHDPQHPEWPDRDRLILSKGHSGMGLYAALALRGYFPLAELDKFASDAEGALMNHPDMHTTPGIEVSTGSLGHGFSIAVGIAMAANIKQQDYYTYCILGDAECQEGQVWEAAMAAGHYRLNKLIAIVDQNGLSNDGYVEQIINLDPFASKWQSFGWNVLEVDGHDVQAIIQKLLECKSSETAPSVLIAHTVKGQGLKASLAGTPASHYIKASDLEQQ